MLDHLLSQMRKRYILFTSFSCHRQFSQCSFSCQVCACVQALCMYLLEYIWYIYAELQHWLPRLQPHPRKQPLARLPSGPPPVLGAECG